jgi:FkbM family methyltransferase
VQSLLQRVMGFDRYLFWFSRFKVATLRRDDNEGDVLHFISMLGRDAVVLDIGANIGIMTVLIARRVDRGRVHSFEPIPENLRALRKIVDHEGLANVSIHEVALGESSGDLEMVMPVQSSVRMQGLSRVVTGGPGDPGAGERYTVPQRRLDDLGELEDVQVAGMKVDVEDFEQFVFRGGMGLLERCRPLVYTELNAGENRTESMALFEGLGYRVCVLEDGALVPWDPTCHAQHNFFMLPPAQV